MCYRARSIAGGSRGDLSAPSLWRRRDREPAGPGGRGDVVGSRDGAALDGHGRPPVPAGSRSRRCPSDRTLRSPRFPRRCSASIAHRVSGNFPLCETGKLPRSGSVGRAEAVGSPAVRALGAAASYGPGSPPRATCGTGKSGAAENYRPAARVGPARGPSRRRDGMRSGVCSTARNTDRRRTAPKERNNTGELPGPC